MASPGPAATDGEDALLTDIAGRVFRLQSYGQPALVKLLDNAQATYNLAATARMLTLAPEHGVPAGDFLDVIGVSTGQSWMSDNIVDVQYDLLLEDVALLSGELGALPMLALDDDVEQAILEARALLGADSANGKVRGHEGYRRLLSLDQPRASREPLTSTGSGP